MMSMYVWRLFFGILFLITFFHSAKALGFRKTFLFLLVTCMVIFPLEYAASTTGFLTGSGYTHNLGGFALGPVPLLILTTGWVVFYWTMAITNKLFPKKTSLLKLTASDVLIAVGFALFADPVAAALHLWQWHEPGIFFGVPVGNFLLWMVAVGITSFLVRTFVYKMKQ